MSNVRIQTLFVIGNYFFLYLINKETAKDECVITFLDNFIFFLGAIHEKHNLNILKIRR
jgi:hypothetical protein